MIDEGASEAQLAVKEVEEILKEEAQIPVLETFDEMRQRVKAGEFQPMVLSQSVETLPEASIEKPSKESCQELVKNLEPIRQAVERKMQFDPEVEQFKDELVLEITQDKGILVITMSLNPEIYGALDIMFTSETHSPERGLVETVEEQILLSPDGDFEMYSNWHNYETGEDLNQKHLLGFETKINKYTPAAIRIAERLMQAYLDIPE